MGRQSVRQNKTIYQQFREEAKLTRAAASDKMEGVSESRIEKIEYGQQEAYPYDVVQMAECYKRPELRNYFCARQCEIGKQYVPEIPVDELPSIILETIASLNEIEPYTDRLIQIARDGIIQDEEVPDFVQIRKKLNQVAAAVNALNLWVDKTVSEQKINVELLQNEEAQQ